MGIRGEITGARQGFDLGLVEGLQLRAVVEWPSISSTNEPRRPPLKDMDWPIQSALPQCADGLDVAGASQVKSLLMAGQLGDCRGL